MKEGTYMNQGSKEKPASIELRVTAKEKDKIQSKVRKCGLSTTEYVKPLASFIFRDYEILIKQFRNF